MTPEDDNLLLKLRESGKGKRAIAYPGDNAESTETEKYGDEFLLKFRQGGYKKN